MPESLLSIFPDANVLLALEPEELGSAVLELAPTVIQNEMFNIAALMAQAFPPIGNGYPSHLNRPVMRTLAEAVSWLVTQGLLLPAPDQPAPGWFLITRRGKNLRTRVDVETYRKGRILPVELLQEVLVRKVWPLFLRGDYDTAVFQAFKEVEIAVRNTSNAKGANFPAEHSGVNLMRDAFRPSAGPLTNTTLPSGEQQGDMDLFAGASGHARNPVGHRDINLPPQTAARLIVFASHLLEIVQQRGM